MKAIGNFVLFVLVVSVFLLFGAGIVDSMTAPAKVSAKTDAKSEMLATPLFAAVATSTQVPTFTASPTVTPVPSSTPLPTVAPSATRDLAALATEQAILQDARNVRLAQDEREMDIAWGWVKLSGVVILMVVGAIVLLIAIVTAYVRTLRGDFKKPATTAPQATEKAQDEEKSALAYKLPRDIEPWLDMIDWNNGGKMPREGEAVYNIWGSQSAYRDFLDEMERARYAYKYPSGPTGKWYVTRSFAKDAGRQIVWGKDSFSQPPTE